MSNANSIFFIASNAYCLLFCIYYKDYNLQKTAPFGAVFIKKHVFYYLPPSIVLISETPAWINNCHLSSHNLSRCTHMSIAE